MRFVRTDPTLVANPVIPMLLPPHSIHTKPFGSMSPIASYSSTSPTPQPHLGPCAIVSGVPHEPQGTCFEIWFGSHLSD